MYGRSRSVKRERGYDSYNYGGGNSYRSTSEPWMSSRDEPDRGSSYYDRSKRGRYDYAERGYRGRGKQRPPRQAASWGRGDPRGRFRGNFGRTRPGGRGGHLKLPPLSEMSQFDQIRHFVRYYYYGGGFRLKEHSVLEGRRIRLKGAKNNLSKGGPPPGEQTKTTAENSTNAEEPAQSTTSGREHAEDGTQKETEPAQSSSVTDQESALQKEIEEHIVLNKIQYFCSLCKFRSFFEADWNVHLQSHFHKLHLRYVRKRIPYKMFGFLEAYNQNNWNKIKRLREQVEDPSTKMHQIFQNQDITLGMDMKEFMKKVEVVHCDACDQFLAMDYFIIQDHIKTHSHKDNCQVKLLNSKQMAFKRVLGILEDKRNKGDLEKFTNGENPFISKDENMRSDLAPEAEELGDMECITYSDSEGEEEGYFQGQNPFINDEEATRSNCSTEVVPEGEESQEIPCITLPDSESGEEEEDSGGQVLEQEEPL